MWVKISAIVISVTIQDLARFLSFLPKRLKFLESLGPATQFAYSPMRWIYIERFHPACWSLASNKNKVVVILSTSLLSLLAFSSQQNQLDIIFRSADSKVLTNRANT